MIIFSFLLGALAHFFQKTLLSGISLLSFSPYIAFVSLKNEPPYSLFLALASGIFLDLFSADPMGVHAISACMTCLIASKFKRLFLFENFLHFSLFTCINSILFSLSNLVFLFLFDKKIPFGIKMCMSDLIIMPLIDGVYAFFWFSLPFFLYKKIKMNGRIYWQLTKKKLSLN